jgi:predicted kinase
VAILFLTCGLMATGKTTVARRLETQRPALRLTCDEWMHQLYPELSGDELEHTRGRVEQMQWSVALRALELGCDVVIDWGLWTREQRDRLRSSAKTAGARVVLLSFEESRAELWQRLSHRNAAAPAGTFHITIGALDRAFRLFQRPTDDELACYDPF